MSKSKIIIVEGAQGAGKTTITDYLRNTVKHTNLYRLSGVSDSSITGLEKSKKMYYDLLDYMKNGASYPNHHIMTMNLSESILFMILMLYYLNLNEKILWTMR